MRPISPIPLGRQNDLRGRRADDTLYPPRDAEILDLYRCDVIFYPKN